MFCRWLAVQFTMCSSHSQGDLMQLVHEYLGDGGNGGDAEHASDSEDDGDSGNEDPSPASEPEPALDNTRADKADGVASMVEVVVDLEAEDPIKPDDSTASGLP